jgi:membrane-associated phospholipid phosphatase
MPNSVSRTRSSIIKVCVILVVGFSAFTANAQTTVRRLSDWLLDQPKSDQSYPLGLSWRVQAEKGSQTNLKSGLLFSLSGSDPDVRADASARSALRSWLSWLPVTGRVRVGFPDARWLQANPLRDPILRDDSEVILPQRPRTVTVVTSTGEICHVIHTPLAEARAYISACDAASASLVDWAWIAQADGRVQRYGISNWNEESQDAPAPGAWIWAPTRDAGWPEGFSEKLVTFLATQGPATESGITSLRGASTKSEDNGEGGLRPPRITPIWPNDARSPLDSAPSLVKKNGPDTEEQLTRKLASGLLLRRSRSFDATAGDWGGIGLLQTPTSRMADTGNISSSISRVYPYTNYNFLVTPLDWLEAGFRYTSVSSVQYAPGVQQAYKDKAFDAKFRLIEESAHMPQLSLGFRDIAGTGLFSGEYLVANKRTGAFDWSLGVGWGYLGSRGHLRNPLSLLSSRFESRTDNSFGQGGTLSSSGYFRGRASFFGGVQYQTPWDNVLLKLEYDGHNYQVATLGPPPLQRNPWNFGVVFRPYKALDVSVGVERGTTAMLTLTWHGNLSELSMPKLFDPAVIPLSIERPQQAPDWGRTARDISAQTSWQVSKIERDANGVRVTIEDPLAIFWKDRVERATSVLHRDAPAGVDRFVLSYRDHGLELAEQVVDRDVWLATKVGALPPGDLRESVIERAPKKTTNASTERNVEYRGSPDRIEAGLGFAYQQTVGGPDGFVLYQAGVEEKLRLRIRDDTWLQGFLRVGLVDNYEKFQVTGPSDLPRVRTYLREYVTTSRVTVPSLYAAHVGKLETDHYFSVYGGYLEPMFAGIGGEWFYRPFQSRIAIGVDANVVQQRGFKQDLALRDYKTSTGHATLYWDTGWNGVQVNLSAGRYLAKDIGATFDFSRVFENGTRVGAFFTRTNVSPQQFGEGSYDKGVYISIPFDTFLPKTTNSYANVLWRPLTRDGGAKLDRPVRLYDSTSVVDARTFRREPAPAPNETLPAADHRDNWRPALAGPAPYSRIVPRKLTTELSPAEGSRYQGQLIESLYQQGFRNIEVSYDAARRLTFSLTNGIQPLNRAAGRVARTALRLAPLDLREIRIDFSDNGGLWARYDFTDMVRLGQFFDGQVGLAEIEGTISIKYVNPAARQNESLALLGDTNAELPSRSIKQVLLSASGAIFQVKDDFLGAGHAAANVEWIRPGLVGAGLILASSLADKRADRFALNHSGRNWLRVTNSVGNALPWIAIGGAAIAATNSSDPLLVRTGYSATEAGVTAIAAVTGLKYVFGRARPENGLGSTSFKPFSSTTGFDSFPSGHTIISWAIATPFAEEYDAPWLYGVAAITNLARVGSRQHWLSDTVAGSALGYGIGKIFWESGRSSNRTGPKVLVGPRSIGLSWALE